MNKKWKSAALVLGLVLSLSASAHATSQPDGAFRWHPAPSPTPPSSPWLPTSPGPRTPGGSSGAAPEVDPSLAIAGISFLAGSLAVLRSRRRA
jgi:hypothetical protein